MEILPERRRCGDRFKTPLYTYIVEVINVVNPTSGYFSFKSANKWNGKQCGSVWGASEFICCPNLINRTGTQIKNFFKFWSSIS